MSDRLNSEKTKADTLRKVAQTPEEQSYWQGYRIGLLHAGQGSVSQSHDAMMRHLDSVDLTQKARAQGYVDGLDWRASPKEQRPSI